MLTSFSDPALTLVHQTDPTLEPLVASIETQLRALGDALRDGDANAVEAHSLALQRSLPAAVQRFAQAARQPGGLPPALRHRLIVASAMVATQREGLARATSALDRAIEVLMPGVAAAAPVYGEAGQADRSANSGHVEA